jgi:hypothetical protein
VSQADDFVLDQAGAAELAEGALQFEHVHGVTSCVRCAMTSR